jgi:hypothetical protein
MDAIVYCDKEIVKRTASNPLVSHHPIVTLGIGRSGVGDPDHGAVAGDIGEAEPGI